MKAPRHSSLAWRVLAFNVLLVMVPALGFMFLDTYETQLLEELERTMSQEGRFTAAALAMETSGPGALPMTDAARRYVGSLARAHESRIRVIARSGTLLADSSQDSPAATESPTSDTGRPTQGTGASRGTAPARGAARAGGAATTAGADDYRSAGDTLRSVLPENTFLYQAVTAPVRFWRRYFDPDTYPLPPDFIEGDYLEAPEIKAAFEGRYGARTRVHGGTSPGVVLYSALPVPTADGGPVQAVVLVSQSTWRILKKLYELRLDNITYVLWGALGALVLTVITVLTVLRPLHRLRNWAETLSDERGKVLGPFPILGGQTELASLSASLHHMSTRVLHYQSLIENFGQDLSHELKNPLASLALSVDMLDGAAEASHADLRTRERRQATLDMMRQDIKRMQTMLVGLRALSMADAGQNPDPDTAGAHDDQASLDWDPAELLRDCVHRCSLAHPDLRWDLDLGDKAGTRICRGTGADMVAFRHIADNLLDNAADFHDHGQPIEVRLLHGDDVLRLEIRDHGPGIPESELSRVWERFYSTRKHGTGMHTGLGLPIVRSLVWQRGGSVRLERAEPGTRAVVELPCPCS